jgi:hypothetical protein
MTGTKTYALLAAIAAAAVFGTASTTWAQYGGGGSNARGSVTACSLSGVNPAQHPEIFGHPAVAATYGFVRSNGSWHVAPGCSRGAATFAPAASALAAMGEPLVALGDPVRSGSGPGGLIESNGLCWVQNNGTMYRWGLCPNH